MVKGQLVQVHHKDKENSWWEYAVVIKCFDDRYELFTETKTRVMYHEKKDNADDFLKEWFNKDIHVTELYANGIIVMAKKSWLGGYKIH